MPGMIRYGDPRRLVAVMCDVQDIIEKGAQCRQVCAGALRQIQALIARQSQIKQYAHDA